MNKETKKEIITGLIGKMLKTVEYIYSEENPKVSYEVGDEVIEYYTGEIARDKYLSAVFHSYSHIFHAIADILLDGSDYDKERMFRIIRHILSKIEKGEKYDERSLLDGESVHLLELRLMELADEV
jgi:hypothetical protein